MPRARPTKAVQTVVLDRQDNRCNACHEPFSPMRPIEWDHWHARGLNGPDESRKPGNWQALCGPCHCVKSARDWKMISKANRIARKLSGEQKRRGPKIRSRGFTGSRRFNGEIVRRT